MKDKLGILIVSHSFYLAKGIKCLIDQVAPDVAITVCGGLSEDEIGTSLEFIEEGVESNPCQEILAFYDLGSARMNLEMAQEMSDKQITIFDVAFVEGTYTAAALLQAGVDKEAILSQLAELEINK